MVAYLLYFFLREMSPEIREPMPSNPNSGSGEAVCGSFPPALCPAFCSLDWVPCVALVWSEEAPAALLADGVCAFWSVAEVPVVELLGGGV